MIRRDMEAELGTSAAEYPVVTVVGPRQSGKTTLVRAVFAGHAYRSLEDPDVRRLATEDPRGFLAEIEAGGILDEIQRAPELLSYLQRLVDEDPTPGRFVLTGSNQPTLRQTVAQTLAGRNAVLTLLPFTIDEVRRIGASTEPFDLVISGLMPPVHDRALQPSRFYRGYYQTYVERDVRLLINLRNAEAFASLLRLLAGRVGQLVNLSSLSNDVGVSSTTIKEWISLLAGSYVVFTLPAYARSVRKRVVKSPKLYFTDVGLCAWLLGLASAAHARRDRCRGGLFENLIVTEVAKWYENRGRPAELYFYRDSNGNEVDLVCRAGRALVPIEIKSARTFTPEFVKGIERFRGATTEEVRSGYVLYLGDDPVRVRSTRAFNPFLHDAELADLERALFPSP
jgi:predicted AAA+ superfamily ATPase